MEEVNKAVTLVYTKDDVGAFCLIHIPVIESVEIDLGRTLPRKELLDFPVDCCMCLALKEVISGEVNEKAS